MYLNTAIRKRIIGLMQEREWAANHLALRAWIHRSGLNKFLRKDTTIIRIETIELLCEACNITLEDFFASPLFKDVEVRD